MRENRPYNSHESSPQLSDLTKKEQEHRHQWQDKYLRSNAISLRIGQVFGLLYNLALLAVVYDLIKDGEKDLALKIFFGNLAIIAFALLVTSLERKISSRKPPRRGYGNRDRRFNNNNRDRDNRDRSNRNDRPDRNDRDRNDRR